MTLVRSVTRIASSPTLSLTSEQPIMETVMTPYNIKYGFLTGNLFGGWSSEEIETLDAAASIRRYADLVEAAILAAFPGSTVEVDWQDAEGILPHNLRPFVCDPADPDHDNWRLTEEVERLASDIYETQDWQVLKEGQ